MSEKNPEEFAQMAVKAKRALVAEGVPLNQFIAKVASDNQLTPKQTALVAHLANRLVRNALAKEAAIVEFDVADPDVIESAIATQRVSAVLDAKAPPAQSSFSASVSGPVQRTSDSVEWKKKASAPDYRSTEQKVREAKVGLATALEELDVMLMGLQKSAGDDVTSGEVLMAAAVVDGSDLPFCVEYCSQRLDVNDCDDVVKYANLELDRSNDVVRGFERLKEASFVYLDVVPELEKQAIMGKLRAIGGLLGKGGKALVASLFGLAVGGEAARGAKLISAGALKNTAPTAVQMAKKIGAPVLTPLGG